MLKSKIRILLTLLILIFVSCNLVSAVSNNKQSKPLYCDFKTDKTVGWAPFDATITAKINIPSNEIDNFQWTVAPNPMTGSRYWAQNAPWIAKPHMLHQGVFDVFLTIATTSGQLISCNKLDYITVYKNSFSAVVFNPSNPKVVTFKYTGNGDPTSFNWNFGDKSTSKQKNTVTHVYKKAGTYTVSLQVQNRAGSSTVSQGVTVV
jgi:hypothetical protein